VPKTTSTKHLTTDSVALEDAGLESLRNRNQSLEAELKHVREQLEWLKRQMFGNRSEKLPPTLPGTTPVDLHAARRKFMDALESGYREANALPKGRFDAAIGYLNGQMPSLRLCLEHARVDLDNSIIERVIRPIAVDRKNWMFAGSDEGVRRSALVMPLVDTCKMLGIDPGEYLVDILLPVKIRPEGDLCRDLTPYQWAKAM